MSISHSNLSSARISALSLSLPHCLFWAFDVGRVIPLWTLKRTSVSEQDLLHLLHIMF